MKKIVSIALAIALICFMIASTAFANETAVLKVETTTTSVQQGENVVIKISMSSNTTKNIAAIGFNVEVPDSFEYVSHTLASGMQYIQTAQEPLDVITDSFQEILRL